jgi:hypothetical protein
LGEALTVETVVRDFAGSIVRIRQQFNEGKIDSDAATGAIGALAKQFAGIFMGSDAGYRVQPWHSPEQLGAEIKKRIGSPEPIERAGEAFFYALARTLLDVVVGNESGEVDDDSAQFRIEAAIEDSILILRGLPFEKEP